MIGNKKIGGFTLFYALLVSSLALAIGATIFDITLREIDLSNAATQSQYALYAADSGAECALYWDSKCTTAGCNSASSAFATGTPAQSTPTPTGSNFICGGVDITLASPSPSNWSVISSAGPPGQATTTFTILGTAYKNQTPCAVVYVAKSGNPSQTTVTSHGYNTCVTGPLQLERVFQVSY